MLEIKTGAYMREGMVVLLGWSCFDLLGWGGCRIVVGSKKNLRGSSKVSFWRLYAAREVGGMTSLVPDQPDYTFDI